MENLLLEIINCPNFIKGQVEGHPCCEILRCQDQYIDKQVPEPWNGNIETARILFLSSNSSIGRDENYPTFNRRIAGLSQGWTEGNTSNFFVNRFKLPYVKNYLYPQQIGGEYTAGWVRFGLPLEVWRQQ
jgi:hypothetical protein